MTRSVLAALAATTALGFAPALAQTQPAPGASAQCDQLVIFVRDNDADAAGLTAAQAAQIAEARDEDRCRTELDAARARLAQAGGTEQQPAQGQAAQGGTISVTQPQPEVSVEVPQPTVDVQVPPPEVVVNQGTPNVIVRQARPTIRLTMPRPIITIDMPQPEIIVQMPQPDVAVSQAQPTVAVNQAQPEVSVSQAQPRVQVEMPKPDVDVTGAGQAEVSVEQGQPVVQLQPARAARVQVQRAEPTVQFEGSQEAPELIVEQEGEPEIRFNQSGQPAVRIEDEQGERQGAVTPDAEGTAAPATATAERAATPEQQVAATTPAAQPAEPAAQPTATQTAATGEAAPRPTRVMARQTQTPPDRKMQALDVARLRAMDVYSEKGNRLGDVEQVVRSGDEVYVIVGAGGFLGFGENNVALPLSDLFMSGNRLIAPDMTEERIESMAEYRPERYQPVGDADAIEVGIN